MNEHGGLSLENSLFVMQRGPRACAALEDVFDSDDRGSVRCIWQHSHAESFSCRPEVRVDIRVQKLDASHSAIVFCLPNPRIANLFPAFLLGSSQISRSFGFVLLAPFALQVTLGSDDHGLHVSPATR